MEPGRPTRQRVTGTVSDRTVVLCALEDLSDGASLGVLPDRKGRDRVVLVRQGPRVHAYINNCPHYDRAPLGWKKNEFLSGDGKHIMCASHGALFRIADGVCELGPCLGQELTRIPVEIDGGLIILKASNPSNEPQELML